MKTHMAILISMVASFTAFAHDEGHGPKLTDAGKQGGVVSAVVDKKDAKLGAKAELVYKAELVRSADGTVRAYFYDKAMNPVDVTKLAKEADGVLIVEKKKKVTTTAFKLALQENAFVGTAPKPSSKPFNIDITVKEGDRELLAAFDNLD